MTARLPRRPVGEVRDGVLPSRLLARTWPYRVYLPPLPVAGRTALPVMYLLHGRGADHTTWTDEGEVAAILDEEILSGRVPPLIALMPQGGDSWYVDGEEPVERALLEEFLPHVQTRYPVSKARDRHLLAGYSMGGYGALRLLLTRPHLFGGALLLSPAIYDGPPPPESVVPSLTAFGQPFDVSRWTALNYPAHLGPLPSGTATFIVAGDADRPHSDPRCNLEVQSALLHARLRGQGVDSQFRVLPGGHDWEVWRPGFASGLRWLTAGWA